VQVRDRIRVGVRQEVSASGTKYSYIWWYGIFGGLHYMVLLSHNIIDLVDGSY